MLSQAGISFDESDVWRILDIKWSCKIMEPYLCEKLDINNYDYFLSCEEDNI